MFDRPNFMNYDFRVTLLPGTKNAGLLREVRVCGVGWKGQLSAVWDTDLRRRDDPLDPAAADPNC
jgi:hypothetical protein